MRNLRNPDPAIQSTQPLEKGEVRYLGHRPELAAKIYAIRPLDGMPPIPLGELLGQRLRREVEIANALNGPTPMTRWAAYIGSACGSEITLHATQRDALQQVATALGIYDDPAAPLADLDDEALTERLDEYCSTRADDWHVNEVLISSPPEPIRCGATAEGTGDLPYTCQLPPAHTGDHVDTSHPMHPTWRQA